MAKKKNKIDTILTRAEKLFKSGNFLLAEKEFEKIQKRLNRSDIDEKLKICRKETRTIKGKDFVKQGHKAVNSNQLSEAIACFQEAEKLLNEPWLTEPWITDKIKELQQRLTWHKIDAKAQEAETARDYLTASELYVKAWKKKGSNGFLLKSAFCLVKVERYGQAAEMFEKSDLSDDRSLYYYGFALAKTGKYIKALKLWEKLDTHDKTFIEQNRQVLSLACSDLDRTLGRTLGPTLGKVEDINDVHNRAKDLLGLAITLGSKELIPHLEILCSYYKLVLIESLWEQEKFAAIPELLLQMTAVLDPIIFAPIILALNAKTYFSLSRNQAKFLEPMMTFWLSAIYSKEISAEFSDNPDKRQKVQHQLIRFAEQHINSHPDSKNVGPAASYLAIERKLLQDLSGIFQKKSRVLDQIITPQYASICGLSDIILDLIKHNERSFKDPEHYLETGGYYSNAGKALYALRTNGVKKAMSLIESIEASFSKDEFTDYVIALVQFEFGQAALENHEKNYLQYFALTAKLFESAPSIEKRFSDKILQYDGDQLISHEKLLTFLHTERRSDYLAEALSFVMIHSVIRKYNRGKITPKQMKVSIEKVLKISPDNEFVLHTLEQTRVDLEIEILFNAMDKHKLSKGARLARQSAYPEVCDRYFEFGEQILEQINSSGLDLHSQKIDLLDLLSSCVTVDPDHPLIDSIKNKLQFLGD